MLHHMKLTPEPFYQMRKGAKTIELRLYDPKRQRIKVGDQIEFSNTQDKMEKFRVQVIALHLFASFSELYQTLPLKACGYTDVTKANPRDMNQYYSLDDQQKYGVVGIEVALVNWKDAQLEKTSRYISFLLRHRPEAAGLTLDEHGWANTTELIECVSKTRHITMTLLEQIVSTDEKQRYAFNADKSLIRANQGHSIPVDVELIPSAPPKKLWHGMDDNVVDAIVSMLMDLQGRENTNLPLYQQQLRETETKIENLLKAITEGVFTKSTKTFLEELEAAKEELENRISLEKLEKPQISEEFMRFWLHRFRKLDMAKKEHRQMLIDVFINAIFLYDDKMLITFNYKEGTKTITFDDVKNEVSEETSGPDLDCSSAPKTPTHNWVGIFYCLFLLIFL